ncbi:Uncharacterized protein TCM_040502 [Theobroma cacao]|uniref:Uncharacterized protein n=1 Tax=Theobroma cacao TaxID=3641 RepID=A0A061GSN8_THECC|nr:Uncharacterized protein TCM_040502 [Theobroma cacao]
MDSTELDFSMGEFWIQVTSVPLKLMNGETAKAIGGMIECFVKIDGEEDNLTYCFLHIRILMDLTKPLRKGIMLACEDNQTKWISFQYEHLPSNVETRAICGEGGSLNDVELQGKSLVHVKDNNKVEIRGVFGISGEDGSNLEIKDKVAARVEDENSGQDAVKLINWMVNDGPVLHESDA